VQAAFGVSDGLKSSLHFQAA
jgi:hypothetical protein